MKGRSVYNALHNVVRFNKCDLRVKEFILAAILDIEGSFNNVNLEPNPLHAHY